MKFIALFLLGALLAFTGAQQSTTTAQCEDMIVSFCNFAGNCPDYSLLNFQLNGQNLSFAQFNSICFENFNANTGDIQGRLAVRNSFFAGAGFSIGDRLDNADAPTLMCGGNATWLSGEAFPLNASLFVGGTFTGPSNLTPRNTGSCSNCTEQLQQPFNNSRQFYLQLSQLMDTREATARVEGNQLICNNATDDIHFVDILDENFFTRFFPIEAAVGCNPTALFVFNVQGTFSVEFSGASIGISERAIWNIIGRRQVTLLNEVRGLILAPLANLTQTGGFLQGNLIANECLNILQQNVQCVPEIPQPPPTETATSASSQESSQETSQSSQESSQSSQESSQSSQESSQSSQESSQSSQASSQSSQSSQATQSSQASSSETEALPTANTESSQSSAATSQS
jgi:choice-of-anchor A domain-containing protein